MNKMKKAVFATQVFALMAMLPLVAILEMNHGKTVVTKRNYTSGVESMPEKRGVVLQGKAMEEKDENAIPLSLETFFLQKAF